MTPTDFDKEALKLWQTHLSGPREYALEYAHAIRDLVLQGNAEPVVWEDWRRILAEKVDEYIQIQSDDEEDCGEAYDSLKAHILATPFTRPQLPPEQQDESWKCFHCEEVFTDKELAALHFGPRMYDTPACQIDSVHLRDLEAQLTRYREEDTDLHREIHGLHATHATALQREEVKGYARGLKDAGLWGRQAELERLRVENEELVKLLLQASSQLSKWHVTYGAWNPNWLPPSGDVKLQEDIDVAVSIPSQPPRDNAHVAEGCEQFPPDELTQLRAENALLSTYRNSLEAQVVKDAAELAALRKQVPEECVVDTRRLDYLESHSEWHISIHDIEDGGRELQSVDGPINDREYNRRGVGGTLRLAIDAAMLATKGKQK